ncbi:MAG: transporter substrate-binding protein [Gammaproteobacteria bacterium]|nr:transporter substrate-binding protein [Gammaproteobacteria bacterium]
MQLDRRQLLTLAGASSLPLMWSSVQAADDIKLGSLLDLSGIFEGYGKPMLKGLELAVNEINAAGGVVGRKVKIISLDTQSDIANYTKSAQQLTRQDKVDLVMGGILSASREAIRPLLNREKTLYFYTPLYEGGVCDRNNFLTGLTPAQQVEVLIPYAMKAFNAKKGYILAADYNYGQYMAKWFTKYVQTGGGSIVGTDFFPLNVSDFNATIKKIQDAKPDFLITALVGGAHLSFFRQWAAAGMKAKIPMTSTTLGVGNEQQILTADEGNGILVAYNYSSQINTPMNKAFVANWVKAYGSDKDINEIACSQYQTCKLWAAAANKAGTLDREAVTKVLEAGFSIDAPSGKITIDGPTHHAILDVHVMEMKNQKLEVKMTSSQRQPQETREVCDLRKNPTSNQQFEFK